MDPKKILVAFDGSENAFRAVEYVAGVASGCAGAVVNIYYVERLPDRDLFPDEASWKERCRGLEAEIRAASARARERLEKAGFAPGGVTETYLSSCRSANRADGSCSLGTSIALDVLQAAREGGYGTVVIGRRGVSKQEEFLFGSVSSKIVHHARGCAVWVVG